MAALITALALAAAQPAARPWICARNFMLDGSEGQAVQVIDPNGKVSAVSVQVWSRRASGARLYWEIPHGSRFAPPHYLSWEMQIPPPAEPLWTRYWGDGRFLGEGVLVAPAMLRRARGQQLWSVSTGDPAILAGLLEAERWEVEIVNAAGSTIARGEVPLPAPAALRSAIAGEIDWLASVIGTQAEPCHEEPDDLESI